MSAVRTTFCTFHSHKKFSIWPQWLWAEFLSLATELSQCTWPEKQGYVWLNSRDVLKGHATHLASVMFPDWFSLMVVLFHSLCLTSLLLLGFYFDCWSSNVSFLSLTFLLLICLLALSAAGHRIYGPSPALQKSSFLVESPCHVLNCATLPFLDMFISVS